MAGTDDLIGLHRHTQKGVHSLWAGLCGASLALLLGYIASYLQTRHGMGVVSAPGTRVLGPEVFALSALNFYALHHIALVGSGRVTDAFGNSTNVSASIVLPLTIWIAAPLVALVVGGAVAGAQKAVAGRRGILTGGLFCGVIYGVVLGCLAPFLHGTLNSFLLPQFSGVTSNPPPIRFGPAVGSALANGCSFGIAFALVGALIIARRRRATSQPGKWWACGKATLLVAIVLQALIVLCILGYFVFGPETAAESNLRVVEMSPSAAGLGYTMVHGATLVSLVESKLRGGLVQKPFYAEANIYLGIKKGNEFRTIPKPIQAGCLFIVVVSALISGRLAVRWGSIDGSLPTGFRCAFVHTLFLLLLPKVCGMFLRQADSFSATSISISTSFAWPIAASFGIMFVFAMFGAHFYSRAHYPTDPLWLSTT